MRTRRQRNWEEATEALGCAPTPSFLDVLREETRKVKAMAEFLRRSNERRRQFLDRLEKRLEGKS